MRTNQSLSELLALPQVDLSSQLNIQPEEAQRLHRLCNTDPSQWSVSDKKFVQEQVSAYTPNQYSASVYRNGYYKLAIQPDKIGASGYPCVVSDIDTNWDATKFREPRAPFVIGSIVDKETYDKPNAVRCLHLPIKMPGSEVRVPDEYIQFAEPLSKILNFEAAFNPSVDRYHAYLTVDQRFVPAGNTQRLPGAHVDGIPRDTSNPGDQPVDHSYIVTSNLGTRFFTHPFPLDEFDLEKHNFFALMRYFADEDQSVVTKPFEINLMNAYSVHTATPALKHCFRTFIRLEFSVLKFDRKGNAVNPFFEYDWDYRPCPIPEHLAFPEELIKERD